MANLKLTVLVFMIIFIITEAAPRIYRSSYIYNAGGYGGSGGSGSTDAFEQVRLIVVIIIGICGGLPCLFVLTYLCTCGFACCRPDEENKNDGETVPRESDLSSHPYYIRNVDDWRNNVQNSNPCQLPPTYNPNHYHSGKSNIYQPSAPSLPVTKNVHEPPTYKEAMSSACATTENLPPGVLYLVKASYKYQAEDVDELAFEVGEVINVVEYEDPEDQEEGWLMGYKEATGQKGMFPANFTRPI